MSSKTTGKFTGENLQHPVAVPRFEPRRRVSASTAAILAGVGHGSTFLTLTAGALWLAVRGPEAMDAVSRIFIAGLYMQALPALGFALVARTLSEFDRRPAALGAGALSLASILLMGVGTVQIVGAPGIQKIFLSSALFLVFAVGVGAFATRLAIGFKDALESEAITVSDPLSPGQFAAEERGSY